jgi:uncharacterized damage-inducible protein DinB
VFTLDGMRQFHQWTHACLDRLQDHLVTIPVADYTKELSGFAFPTMREQVIHLFNSEGFWIHALQGLSYTDGTPAEFPDAPSVRRLQHELSRQTLAYLASLTDQQLNSDTELCFPDGGREVRTPALVLHHFLTHAFHHKGQIVAMCRVLGRPAPDTHVIQFE